MITYMFPGQGSQKIGMGNNLFSRYKEQVAIADEILGFSIEKLCLEDPDGRINSTQFTQPALFFVNGLSHLEAIEQNEQLPDYLVGHSLGEYNALAAAGVFDLATGIELVKKRGELMSRVSGSGMAAVIGLDEKTLIEVIRNNNFQQLYVANYNSPEQLVIAGNKEELTRSQKYLESAGAKIVIPLKVSAAFHTPFMQSVQDEFSAFLNDFSFSPPSIPVISNCYASHYEQDAIKETLSSQISSPVKWTQCIEYLLSRGEMKFFEIGPGHVLQGLLNKITLYFKQKKQEKNIAEPREASVVDCGPHAESDSPNIENASPEISSPQNEDCSTPQHSAQYINFTKEYKVKHPYIAGGMSFGISSKEMVCAMAKAGYLSFLGCYGLSEKQIINDLRFIQQQLSNSEIYGMNLSSPDQEKMIIDLAERYNVQCLEISNYGEITPAIAEYRIKGLAKGKDGEIIHNRKILAKVSDYTSAKQLLSPIPEHFIKDLEHREIITHEQALLARKTAAVDDLCWDMTFQSDDTSPFSHALLPRLLAIREDFASRHGYAKKTRIGLAGGIGTPEAAANAFLIGAELILTASINQCSVEADMSEQVKNILEKVTLDDLTYAPCFKDFIFNGRVPVVAKGTLFPMRAKQLQAVMQNFDSLGDIPYPLARNLQEVYLEKDFEQFFDECKNIFPKSLIEQAEKLSKLKMDILFRGYIHKAGLAVTDRKTLNENMNKQIRCSSALAEFNQLAQQKGMESWRNRKVKDIADFIMDGAKTILAEQKSNIFLW